MEANGARKHLTLYWMWSGVAFLIDIATVVFSHELVVTDEEDCSRATSAWPFACYTYINI